MKFFWLIVIAFVTFFFSCKKKEFPASTKETESGFYFNATIDGVPVSLKSGVNGYYMYSSNSQDSAGVYTFIADLKQDGCTNCAGSLQIKINDFKVSEPNAAAQIDVSLAPKNYPIQGKVMYAVQFQSIYNQTAASYLWNFGDNTTSTLANPSHNYDKQGNYKVSLRIRGSNGCEQYMNRVERIKYPAKFCNIFVESDTVNTLFFKPHTNGFTPVSYLWSFGDGAVSNSVTPYHSYNVAGTYPVSLRVVDTSLDTVYTTCNVATRTNPMPCLTNYNITAVIPVSDILALSNITVTWTDEGGTVYSSNNSLQPETSYFKIISVENYNNNEKNEPTKRIKIQFKCNVYNGTSVKTIDNVEAVVGVSYK